MTTLHGHTNKGQSNVNMKETRIKSSAKGIVGNHRESFPHLSQTKDLLDKIKQREKINQFSYEKKNLDDKTRIC